MSGYGALTFGVMGTGGAGVSFDWQDDGSFKVSVWDPSGAPLSATLTPAQSSELGGYLAGALGPISPPEAVTPTPAEPDADDESSSAPSPASTSSSPTSSSGSASSSTESTSTGDSGA